METPKKAARRERIEAAAYAVVKESGYKSASLLAIAQRASASNGTLYSWYGNKAGLFASLIQGNAQEVRQLLEQALQEPGDPLATLKSLGPILLAMVTGERAITLSRAAVMDTGETGTLGPVLARFGRDAVAPLVAAWMERAISAGLIVRTDPTLAADVYFRLLIGDLQARRMTGALDELTAEAIQQRADDALALFLRIYAPPGA